MKENTLERADFYPNRSTDKMDKAPQEVGVPQALIEIYRGQETESWKVKTSLFHLEKEQPETQVDFEKLRAGISLSVSSISKTFGDDITLEELELIVRGYARTHTEKQTAEWKEKTFTRDKGFFAHFEMKELVRKIPTENTFGSYERAKQIIEKCCAMTKGNRKILMHYLNGRQFWVSGGAEARSIAEIIALVYDSHSET